MSLLLSVEAKRPSNIALIKYMGKKEGTKNIPINPSLSYTLNHLHTTVKLTAIDNTHHLWEKSCQDTLSETEKSRFLKHLDFLRDYFNCTQFFKINSHNNFPSGCGLASSASSFAALTEAAVLSFHAKISIEEIAKLSRQGSGSSCRSFFSPFALWEEENVSSIDLPYANLLHHVIVVSKNKKSVSSSESHLRVKTSSLFKGRQKRAETRLINLLKSLEEKDWEKSYHIIYHEFWDMHGLFETAENPFSYLLPDSIKVLHYLEHYWKTHKDGPWITMDAGPNIHLLFREDQKNMAKEIKDYFSAKFLVL